MSVPEKQKEAWTNAKTENVEEEKGEKGRV